MRIYIPTMGRTQSQRTLEYIPKSLQKQTFIVCPPDEKEAHRDAHRNVLICKLKGIAPTRQFLVDYSYDHGNHKMVMSDDDHYFYRRENPSSPKLIKCTELDMENMFASIEKLLDTYPMVGISARQGNDAYMGLRITGTKNYEIEPGLALNKRVCNMYGVRTDILRKENIRFDSVSLMEDMNVELSLITRGYDVALITNYAWNQSASGSKGGCASYRNYETQREAAIKLAELHRPFVTVIKKKSKDKSGLNWKTVGSERIDVRVDWTGASANGKQSKARLI